MPRPRRVEQIARQYEGAARAAILRAWDALQGQIPVQQILDAMSHGVEAVIVLLASARLADDIIREAIEPLIRSMRAAGVNAAGPFRIRFDLPDPAGAARVMQTADLNGWLRFNVTAEGRGYIDRAIRQAFMEGGHPYETARLIRGSIGLNTVQAGALERFAAGLPDSMTPAAREAAIGRLEARYIRQRAEMIARTETLRAAREGQEAAWQQATDEGLLEADRTWRVWIPASDACDICLELADHPIPFAESFPDTHPNCRCSEGLEFDVGKARIAKPLGVWADWDACVTSMTRRLGSVQAAERYCGKLQSLLE